MARIIFSALALDIFAREGAEGITSHMTVADFLLAVNRSKIQPTTYGVIDEPDLLTVGTCIDPDYMEGGEPEGEGEGQPEYYTGTDEESAGEPAGSFDDQYTETRTPAAAAEPKTKKRSATRTRKAK